MSYSAGFSLTDLKSFRVTFDNNRSVDVVINLIDCPTYTEIIAVRTIDNVEKKSWIRINKEDECKILYYHYADNGMLLEDSVGVQNFVNWYDNGYNWINYLEYVTCRYDEYTDVAISRMSSCDVSGWFATCVDCSFEYAAQKLIQTILATIMAGIQRNFKCKPIYDLCPSIWDKKSNLSDLLSKAEGSK